MQCMFHSNCLTCPLAIFLKMYLLVCGAKLWHVEERKLICSDWIFSTHTPFSIYNSECKIFPYSLRICFFNGTLFFFPLSRTLDMNTACAQNNNNQTLLITIHFFLAHAFNCSVGRRAIHADRFISSAVSLVENCGTTSSWRNHAWEPVCFTGSPPPPC